MTWLTLTLSQSLSPVPFPLTTGSRIRIHQGFPDCSPMPDSRHGDSNARVPEGSLGPPRRQPGLQAAWERGPGVARPPISGQKSRIWIFSFITWLLTVSNSIQPNRKWLQSQWHLGEQPCKLWYLCDTVRMREDWVYDDLEGTFTRPPPRVTLTALHGASTNPRGHFGKHRPGRLRVTSPHEPLRRREQRVRRGQSRGDLLK